MKFKQYLLVTIVGLAISGLLIILDVFEASHFSLLLFIIVTGLVIFWTWKKSKWAFWIFLMLLPLEKVIISPINFPFSVRSYQLVGFVLVMILIIKWIFKRLDFKLLSFKRICLACKLTSENECDQDRDQRSFGLLDKLIFLLIIFALLGIVSSPDRAASMKLTLVLVSFIALFWLVRNFLQTKTQKLEALWFFSIGAVPIFLFGAYQAIAFRVGWSHFEVFNARINATFSEPDWFGIYLVFLLALELFFLLVLEKARKKATMIGNFNIVRLARMAVYVDIFLICSLLFLTVSRSSWIGGIIVILSYFLLLVFSGILPSETEDQIQSAPIKPVQAKFKVQKFNSRFKMFAKEIIIFLIILLVAVVFVSKTGLSTFHLSNRATSSISGMQKITISCEKNTYIPRRIEHISQLDKYGCRHIDLEKIESELARGKVIKEAYRPDPNVAIRKNTYARAWEEIKKHPILGQGLGSSAVILGTDEQGSGLNASNIFLETWLSMGVGGLVILIWILLYPVGRSKLELFRAKKGKKKIKLGKQLGLFFVILTSGAIIVPNLFNSGLLMGFFWVWLASVISIMSERQGKNV